ncbi:MAG: hypothetical protein Q8N76_00465 [Candidatus Omnitrophota bacterium]|nr:hypothetical protein [Candidatus Omnitrophota bacterium]
MLNLEIALNETELKAWRALAGYKFMMFGYWAAIWVHLNRVGEFNRQNPFKPLVDLASDMIKEAEQYKEARTLIE